ncbi:MAG TPA: metallophosphoesterase family protein [Bryobacteraceae bacterium]|nr:metallophosphoesterase family protein [Bryobacteraceae bacterium]
MRYLILSDLHSNWEALEAVLRDAEGAYDQALCCGDLVGYGADPNRVTEWVRGHCATVVRGNHDRACTGLEDLEWFNPVARQAAVWTLQRLSPENAAYVRGLPHGPVFVDGIQLLHGSPTDEDEYVVRPEDAAGAFAYLESHLAFFGHSHIQGGFLWNHSRVETIPPVSIRGACSVMDIEPDTGYLLNPGSVGQPRDGDPRAAYMLYDSGASMARYRRVPYDVEKAQRKIRDAGLPPFLADRLAAGR